ncbi:MAG: hypothetical protein U1E22_06935, partial [Coriobacteriia bacterium]|nr:hypothetical protein [Coriobacteriia bacterium]
MIGQIGDESTEILLFQLQPGRDSEAAAEIGRALDAADCQHALFKVLGRHDLVAVVSHAGSSDTPTLVGIPGVSSVETMPCFQWGETGTGSACVLEFSRIRRRLLGLTLIKLKPELLARGDVTIERQLVAALSEYVESAKLRVSHVLLGGLGWSEIILLVAGDSFGDVLSAIAATTSVVVTSYDHNDAEQPVERLTLKSHTTVGISREIIEKERFSELSEIVGGRSRLQLELHIARYPEFDAELKSFLVEEVGVPREVFGTYDLAVTMSGKTAGTCVEDVLRLREAFAGKLIATTTDVTRRSASPSVPPEERQSEASESVTNHAPGRLPEALVVPLDESLFQQASEVDPGLGSLLRNLFATFRNYELDPLLRDTVADMRPFVTWFAESLPIMINAPGYHQDLERALEMYSLGIQQRVAGTYTSLGEMQLPSLYRGGIHRIIQAASVIPRAMLAKVGIRWTGFIVFGAARAYRKDVGGIINLSTDMLYRPEEWWGLFHEVGHEYWYNKPVFDPGGEIDRFAHLQLGEDSHDALKNLTRVMWEALADVYDFVVGFDRNCEDYYAVVWRYLARSDHDSRDDLLFYFTRALCVHLYARTEDGPNDIDLTHEAGQLLGALALHVSPQQAETLRTLLDEAVDYLSDS